MGKIFIALVTGLLLFTFYRAQQQLKAQERYNQWCISEGGVPQTFKPSFFEVSQRCISNQGKEK